MLRQWNEVPGVKVVEAKHFHDERGFLLQSWVKADLDAQGIPSDVPAGDPDALEARRRARAALPVGAADGQVRALRARRDHRRGRRRPARLADAAAITSPSSSPIATTA